MVAKSLEICSSDGLNSISFPTIGTGNLRYPPSDASRFILSTIVQFLDENPSTTVKKITIVIHHDSTSVLKNIEAVTIYTLFKLNTLKFVVNQHLFVNFNCFKLFLVFAWHKTINGKTLSCIPSLFAGLWLL